MDNGTTASITEETTEGMTTTAEQTTALPPIEYGVKTLDITWYCGYVAAPWNNQANLRLMKNASGYSYSDIITIPHAGTKISFKVSAKTILSDTNIDNILIFSIWNETDGEWEMARESNMFYSHSSKKTAISQYSGGYIEYTYVTASNWENIRLCYKSGQTSSKDTSITHPNVTKEYTGEISTIEKYTTVNNKTLVDWLAESKEKTNYTCLEGKTIYFLGDSYFDGNGSVDKRWTWPTLLAQKYNMNFVNHGMGGTTISNVNANSMVNRYKKLPAAQPDIVIVEGGRNDLNNNVPIGTNTDTNDKTFKGGLNKLIDGVRAKYPNALIICVTVWETGGTATNDKVNTHNLICSDYGNAMLELCEYKGVVCFNAMDEEATGVYMSDMGFRKKYADGGPSHLNQEGMKLAMPAFEKFIAEEYEKFIK